MFIHINPSTKKTYKPFTITYPNTYPNRNAVYVAVTSSELNVTPAGDSINDQIACFEAATIYSFDTSKLLLRAYRSDFSVNAIVIGKSI